MTPDETIRLEILKLAVAESLCDRSAERALEIAEKFWAFVSGATGTSALQGTERR